MKATINEITRLAGNNRIWIAFSGGVDSHVLLHLLATSLPTSSLTAVHINHGLHADAAAWAAHCETVATRLGVALTTIEVNIVDTDDKGIEAAARTARYQAIRNTIQTGDVVVTAQHQQDQAETLLLQLLRGAGPKGLSAMPAVSAFGVGRLCRPFLACSKAAILAYAQQHKLEWVEDPSNADSRWDRNYLRHQIWPTLIQRWPAAAKTVSRSAAHCADASDLLDNLAAQDMVNLGRNKQSENLPVSSLLTLPANRCRNLLRHWCQWQGHPLPSTEQLQHIIEAVCLAAADAMPLVQWQGVEVRRYQGMLYVMAPLPEHDKQRQFKLLEKAPIDLSNGQLLCWQQNHGEGLKSSAFDSGWRVAFRQGGERIRLAGHPHHSQLKHLMQQWKIPPWLRDRVPLIFEGDNLIAVVGYAVAEGYAASGDELGINPMTESKTETDDFD